MFVSRDLRPYLPQPRDPAIDVGKRVRPAQVQAAVPVGRRRLHSIAAEQPRRLEREGLLQLRSDLVLPVVEVADEFLDAFALLPTFSARRNRLELAAETERQLHLLVQVRTLGLRRVELAHPCLRG